MEPGASALTCALRATATPSLLALHSLHLCFAHTALQLEGDTIHQLLAFLSEVGPLLAAQPAAPPAMGSPQAIADALRQQDATVVALTELAAGSTATARGSSGGADVAGPQAAQSQTRPRAIVLAGVVLAPLRLVFSFAAPRDRALRAPRGTTTMAKIPIMLLSAAGVSCANFTVRQFESGDRGKRPQEVVEAYTGLVKEAVFTVRTCAASFALATLRSAVPLVQVWSALWYVSLCNTKSIK